MRRSLQRRLSMVLGGVILIAGCIAALASFGLAYSDAKEFQDDLLRQIAKLSAGKQEGTIASNVQLVESNDEGVTDPESLVSIYHLPSKAAPSWLKNELSLGLHTLNVDSEALRVFVHEEKNGSRTIVSQPTEVRDEIAINSAMRTLIPLLFLLPILVALIIYIVRSELGPIKRLSQSLDEQSAERPQAIADDGLPNEITPFVHAINRLLDRVNQLMSQQRRFIANAAHELRSPLTALSLQAQNLKNSGSLEVARERVVPLQEGIERARQLTEQLLNLARIQSKEKVESDINLSTMARSLLSEYLPFAEKKGIDLGIEDAVPVSMYSDSESLRLILKNALENAIKYTPDGGKVTLRLMSAKERVIIEIIDNGPGIPVSEQERVFQPFYRMQDTSVAGTGLGLTIAKEAAVRLGGILSLHEVPNGGGLMFRFEANRGRMHQ